MKCIVDGCTSVIEKEGYTLCYPHWKAHKAGQVRSCAKCHRWMEMAGTVCGDCAAEFAGDESDPASLLSSTKLGDRLNLPARRMNLLLTELGWIEKHIRGWHITDQGRKIGGVQKEAKQTGVPYVVWPAGVIGNKVLQESVQEARGEGEGSNATPSTPSTTASAPTTVGSKAADFRSKFPATHRSTDGHLVRSRAEMLIDNWLYMQQMAHAYERKLPVEEDVYCDFYLPAGKVYIEYWGMEKDPAYASRMQEKKAVYAKHGLNLIELTDQEILNLDDVLPRLLLKFGISSD